MKWLDRVRQRPALFYRRDGEIAADMSGAFSVAHNAGEALDAAARALAHHADVVEIDVMSRGGRLLAGHPRNAWMLSRVFLATTPLEAAWEVASRATAVKLDLKESSDAYLGQLTGLLDGRSAVPTIAVTRKPEVLERLARDAPWVGRFLSITREGLVALQRDETLAARIDGVSGHPDRFDAGTIAWLRDRRLVSMTSVVNSMAQANDLIDHGVNGIITDNLAVMEAIGVAAGRDVRGVVFQKRG